MGISLAEFFINLGIKGNVKTKDALAGVHDTLKGARDMSWEMKAGIAAAVIGLEEISRSAVTTAVDLRNFSGATGYSTGELQKWEYWAQKNGLAAGSLEQAFRGLSAAQAAAELGINVPAGFGYFQLDPRMNKDEMISRMQKKLREIGSDPRMIGMARTMFATMGMGGDDVFAALRIGTVGFEGFTKQMRMTTGEVEKLLALHSKWVDFWAELKGGSNKFVANDLAGPIGSFVDQLRNSLNVLESLSAKFHKISSKLNKKEVRDLQGFFEALGAGAAILLGGPFVAAVGLLVAFAGALDQINKFTHGKDSVIGDLGNAMEKFNKAGAGPIKEGGDWLRNKLGIQDTGFVGSEAHKQMVGDLIGSGALPIGAGAKPDMSFQITQHNIVHEATDGHAVKKLVSDGMKQTIREAVSQLPGLNQSAVPNGK